MGDTLTVAWTRPDTANWDFDALYRSACDDVYAYVRSVVHDPVLAEDVTAAAGIPSLEAP